MNNAESKNETLKRRMRRWWWTAILVCAVILSVGFLLLFSGKQYHNAIQGFLQTLITAAYILTLLKIGLPLNVHPQMNELHVNLGSGTWITIIRAMLIALLAGFLFQPWPHSYIFSDRPSWVPGIMYVTASILDYLDGLVARKTNHKTQLGANLDINIDAIGLVVAPLLAVWYGRLPVAYLSVSAAYYVFIIGIHLRKKFARTVHDLVPRRIARITAGVQMGFVGIALLPIFPSAAINVAAFIFMAPLLAGFIRDWCFVCGYLRPDRYHEKARMTST